MIALDVEREAALNLVGTYFRLGAATPGSRVWRENGFRACTGLFEHPICNFAADLNLTPSSAWRLREIALGRPCFSVYALPGDEPNEHREMLQEVGFRVGHTLEQMVAEPAYKQSEARLLPAATESSRLRVSHFMVEQFFSRQAHWFRKRVAETTAAAVDLPLYSIETRGKTIGAVMLSDEASVIGVYNLCVASSFRGRGWGTQLVHAVLNFAGEQGKRVVLQCDASLKTWYCDRTFTARGAVHIHNLPKFGALDIMEQA